MNSLHNEWVTDCCQVEFASTEWKVHKLTGSEDDTDYVF